jgi:hypothetical protein
MEKKMQEENNPAIVERSLNHDKSLHIVVRATRESLPDFRRALVYRVAGSDPAVWRTRIELYPDHVDGGDPTWRGGRVLWGHDQVEREPAEGIARAWVAFGTRP